MRHAMIVLAAALLLAPAARGQGTPGTVELTPTVGYWFGDTLARGTVEAFDFDVEVDDAPVYGLRLAYRFTENWALEGMLSHGTADLTTGGELFGGDSVLGEIDMTTAELGFEASFGHNRLVPFLAGGIGAMNLDPDLPGTSADTRFLGHFGAGFKLFFTPNVAFRFDFRGHSVNVGGGDEDCDWWDDCRHEDEWLVFKEVGVGLSFVF